jgi:hypothetical protein
LDSLTHRLHFTDTQQTVQNVDDGSGNPSTSTDTQQTVQNVDNNDTQTVQNVDDGSGNPSTSTDTHQTVQNVDNNDTQTVQNVDNNDTQTVQNVDLQLPMQLVPITTKVVSSNPAQASCTRYNIM